MKKAFIYSLSALCMMSVASSCDLFKLDNFDGPDAGLSGRIIDEETGENVQTDIINGTTIRYVEQGFKVPQDQRLRVKNDGTYANTMMFSGEYIIQPENRNFYQIEEQTIQLKGQMTLDFKVTPYIRVKNVSITKADDDNNVVAKFNVESIDGAPIKSIALFASDQPTVGNAIYLVGTEQALGYYVPESKELTLKINVAKNSAYFREGKDYYFRVGALTGVTSDAKYNYATAVKLNIGKFQEEKEPEYYYFNRCESLDKWNGGKTLSLDSSNPQEGEYAIKTETGGVVMFQYGDGGKGDVLNYPGTMEKGVLALDLFISNVADAGNWAAGDANIEICSGGGCDKEERAWPLRQASLRLQNGWNHLVLPLKNGNPNGNINLTHLNYLRVYHTSLNGGVTMMIDNIRLYEAEDE